MIIGNNDKISVQGSTFNLAAFACALGNVAAQAVDLSPYQGQTVRVYLDGNLQIRINPREDMFWQLAGMSIPAPQSRQIQQGTIEVEKTESATILRGETDFDAVPGLGDKEIISVGHYWQNLRKGIEWRAEATGVRWIGERSPQTGEEYPVELKDITEEPHMVSMADPLDLDGVMIQVFENPA
ncbi:MAG: hypothetical protein STSR0003_03490 [Smithella sp.]